MLPKAIRSEPDLGGKPMKLSLGMLLASCFLVAAGFRADDAGDWKELKGDWQTTKLEIDGNALPAEEVKEFLVTLSEGKYAAKRSGEVIDEGKAAIDGSKTPKHLDLTASMGDNKDKLRLGIFEVKDGVLKFVIAGPDKERPTKFESAAGSGNIYLECKKK
jgi:uncharacterized protein (TIGR03067 family)